MSDPTLPSEEELRELERAVLQLHEDAPDEASLMLRVIAAARAVRSASFIVDEMREDMEELFRRHLQQSRLR